MKYCFILFLLLFSLCAYAQNEPGAGFGVESNIMLGKVFKHTTKFTLPIPSVSSAYEINLQWKTCGNKLWQERLHFPVWGFGITYTDYGSDNIYGRVVGFYPNLQIPIIRGTKLEWTLRMGFGIGIASRHYSRGPIWDTTNDAIGSQLNNFSLFMTDLRYHLNKHWDLQAGMNFSHMSNGTFRQPNLGINMYGGHFGIRYFPVTSEPLCTIRHPQPLKNRYLIEGRASVGFTSADAPMGPLYKIYFGTLYVSKRWHSKNKVYAGIDYSYHEDVYAFLRNNEIDPGTEAQHSWKSAVLGGTEFGVGCVGIILQLGVYIHEAALTQDPYYEKLGMHIYLIQKEHGPLKELFLSALLKTHKTVAETAEFGVGMGF